AREDPRRSRGAVGCVAGGRRRLCLLTPNPRQDRRERGRGRAVLGRIADRGLRARAARQGVRRPLAFSPGARRGRAAGRHPCLLPGDARPGGEAEEPMGPRHSAAGLGSSRLERQPGRVVDAVARSPRTVQRAGAVRRLPRTDRRRGADRRRPPRRRSGVEAGCRAGGTDRPELPCARLARCGEVRLHDARIRLARGTAGARAASAVEHRRDHGRPPSPVRLCAHSRRRAAAMGQDLPRRPSCGDGAAGEGGLRRAAAFRGQPLLVLLAMLAAWAGLRAAWWPMPGVAADRSVPILAARRWISGLSGQAAAAPAALAETTFGPSVPPLRAPGGPDVAAAIPLHPTGVELGEEATPVDVFGHPLRPVPTGVAIGHTLLLAAGLSQLDLPPALAAYLGLSAPQVPGIPAATPTMAHLPPASTGATGPRLSAAAWVMVRDDTAPVAAGLPSYGRSQAGAVVRYRLAPSSRFDPQMYARATGAVSGPLAQDLGARMSARLAKVPMRVGAW